MRLPLHAGDRARRSVGQHTVSSVPPFLVAPHARFVRPLRDFATNRHVLPAVVVSAANAASGSKSASNPNLPDTSSVVDHSIEPASEECGSRTACSDSPSRSLIPHLTSCMNICARLIGKGSWLSHHVGLNAACHFNGEKNKAHSPRNSVEAALGLCLCANTSFHP
jgi:hypothetical protein